MFYEDEIPEIPHITLDAESRKTYVPFLLTTRPLLFSPGTLQLISDAERAFSRVDEHMELSPYREALRNYLVNIEAISACVIDGIPANIMELLEHDLEFADSNVDPSSSARTPHLGEVKPINYKRLIELHTSPKAMRGFTYDNTSLYRIYVQLLGYDLDSFRSIYLDRNHKRSGEMLPIITTGSNLPPSEVNRYMDDFYKFCNRTDYTPLIQSALVHFQLSSIRPLEVRLDALGRHLSYVSYSKRNFTHNIFMPISTGSLRYRVEFRQGGTLGPDDTRSVSGRPLDIWLINAAGQMLRFAKRLLRFEQVLSSVENDWRESMPNAKHGDVCDLLLVDLLKYPVTNTAHAMTISNRTFPAANEAIRKLVDCGVLEPINDQKRNRLFVAPAMLEFYRDFFRTTLPYSYPRLKDILGE